MTLVLFFPLINMAIIRVVNTLPLNFQLRENPAVSNPLQIPVQEEAAVLPESLLHWARMALAGLSKAQVLLLAVNITVAVFLLYNQVNRYSTNCYLLWKKKVMSQYLQNGPISKHRPFGPMLSISRNVHMSICPYVCLFVCLSVCSLLRYRLTVFLPPLPEVGCLIFLEIRNPWGKVMERSGLRFEHFSLEVV